MTKKEFYALPRDYRGSLDGKPYALTLDPERGTISEPVEFTDAPTPGRQYALTGASGTKAIANGNSWAESEIKHDVNCKALHMPAFDCKSCKAEKCSGVHASVEDIINCKDCSKDIDELSSAN